MGGACDAVSGIYIARPSRDDAGDDAGQPYRLHRPQRRRPLRHPRPDLRYDLAGLQPVRRLQPLRRPGHDGHAHKVSYNRPFTTRDTPTEDWLFNAEYPMVRWLERNGYDVSYFTDLDSDRHGSEILNHKMFMSSGHDEYWSAGQRASVEAAREAGVNLAFFSGNEIYWKTRWENPPTDRTRPIGRSSATRKATRRAAPNTSTAPELRLRPRPGRVDRAVAPEPTGGQDGGRPENACPARSAGATTRQPSRSRLRITDSVLAQHRDPGRRDDHARGPTLGYEFDWQPAYASTYPTGRIAMSDTNDREDAPDEPLSRPAERRARVRRGHRPMVVGPRRDP